MSDSTPTTLPNFTHGTINLASAHLGAKDISSTDEFFAPLSRMLNDAEAIFIDDKYDDHGKWMDGWESRRKRTPGHDHAIIRLAVSGNIVGFDIDTSHFTGNYPPQASIEAALIIDGEPDENTQWSEILSTKNLNPSAHHFFEVDRADNQTKAWSHLRLHIYPDGGIARLRVFGRPVFDWDRVNTNTEIDLAYVFHGGKYIACSDAHYGSPDLILGPGRGINMGDGWETARRRGPGHDWAIIKLGHAGIVERIILDTKHFKGNYPHHFDLLGCSLPNASAHFSDAEIDASASWAPILKDELLQMDHIHEYSDIASIGAITHIRLNIHPDGGVSRLRVFGRKP